MKKSLFIILGTVSISSLYGVDLSKQEMVLYFNGHEHKVPDILSQKIVKAYLGNKSAIKDSIETV